MKYLLLLLVPIILFSQPKIRNIHLEQRQVFDSLDGDWFFAASWANAVHIDTKEFVIKDEVLFKIGDEIDEFFFDETERNLRRLDLFSKVDILVDSIDEDNYDVIIRTKDKWSLQPAILYGTSGGFSNYGARFAERNLFGAGYSVNIDGIYRQENNIGLQGSGTFSKIRFARLDADFNYSLTANKYKTSHQFDLTKPFRSFYTDWAIGTKVNYDFGNDFIYNFNSKQSVFAPVNQKIASAWFSKARVAQDKIFFTGLFEYHQVDRGPREFERAFDNTGKILLQFSSVSKELTSVTKVNNYLDEDLTIGGYGSAILGRAFPIGNRGDNLYYIGGVGEISNIGERTYYFMRVGAASGFYQSNARYTYQDLYAVGFYKLTDNTLILGRVSQQTTWNWSKQRQLVLDADAGLRGYSLNQFNGANRLIANLESRFFNDTQFWIFNLSTALFCDIGTVWNTGSDLFSSKYYSSVGAGIRLHINKATGPNNTLRFDLAYNLYDKKLGFVFTIDQLFSGIMNHEFRIPRILGTDFDSE
jgi:outer membrane protein assembly factor BamA